jgi:hypothetical protein
VQSAPPNQQRLQQCCVLRAPSTAICFCVLGGQLFRVLIMMRTRMKRHQTPDSWGATKNRVLNHQPPATALKTVLLVVACRSRTRPCACRPRTPLPPGTRQPAAPPAHVLPPPTAARPRPRRQLLRASTSCTCCVCCGCGHHTAAAGRASLNHQQQHQPSECCHCLLCSCPSTAARLVVCRRGSTVTRPKGLTASLLH